MIRGFLPNFILVILVGLTSCATKPEIQISDTLELGLGKGYSDYVEKLNSAVDGDTTALHDFLIIKGLYDGAAYEHGWILIELMRKIGDGQFTTAVIQLNGEELNNLKVFFNGGLDMHSRLVDLPKDYPNSFKALGIN